jgi:GxxExxY protein
VRRRRRADLICRAADPSTHALTAGPQRLDSKERVALGRAIDCRAFVAVQRTPDEAGRERPGLGTVCAVAGPLRGAGVHARGMHEASPGADVNPDRLSFVHAVEIAHDAVPEFQQVAPAQRRALYERMLREIAAKQVEIEFTKQDIPFSREVFIPIYYRNTLLKTTYRADFVCFDAVVVELKAIDMLSGKEEAQLLNYLKVSKKHIATTGKDVRIEGVPLLTNSAFKEVSPVLAIVLLTLRPVVARQRKVRLVWSG